jgi:hypothetical protein
VIVAWLLLLVVTTALPLVAALLIDQAIDHLQHFGEEADLLRAIVLALKPAPT